MQLDPDDIEQIAHRVAELIGEGPGQRGMPAGDGARFIDAAAVARMLGVERDWVYEHATQLGGIRLGGPRGRLRFDRQTLPERLAEAAHDTPSPATPSGRVAATARRPRDGRTSPGQDTGRSVPMPDGNRSRARQRGA